MRHHVFISYSHNDVSIAERVERELRRRGFLCWRDPQLRCGPQFPKRLAQEIADSQAVLVLVSEASAGSTWVRKELRLARKKRIPILPALIANCKRVPPRMRKQLGEAKHLELGDASSDAQIRQLVDELRRLGVGSLTDLQDTELDQSRLLRALPVLQDSPDATDRLRALSRITSERFAGTPGNGLWSVHGLRHTNATLHLLGQLLPAPLRETDPHACFCLAAAACLHDTGLVVRDVDPPELALTPAQDYKSGAVGQVVAVRRADHHHRCLDLIYRAAGEAQLSGAETSLIADLCRYHNWATNVQEQADRPHRCAELISLFRIANACDLGPLRAPPHFWSIFHKQILEEANANGAGTHAPQGKTTDAAAVARFWFCNLLTKSVDIDPQGRKIVITVAVPAHEYDFLARHAFDGLGRAIAQLAPFAGPWSVTTKITEDETWPTGFSIDAMIRFGAQAVCDPEAVVWSSGDIWNYFVQAACALLAPSSHRSSTSASGSGATSALEASLAVLDELARTLPRSRPELHALQDLSQNFRHAKANGAMAVYRAMCQLREQRRLYPADPDKSAFSKIAASAYAMLEAQASNKDVFRLFLFGYSGPVADFVRYCVYRGKRVEIVTPLMRPVGEGPKLQIVERFRDHEGITVRVIPDAAIPFVLQSACAGGGEDLRCDVVMMGCEAIIEPPGSSGTGPRPDVASSLGCLAIAHLAHASKVPLWVLTESAKASVDPEVSCWVEGAKTEVSKVPVQAFLHEVAAAQAASKQQTCLPRSEVIPGELIDAIITERGVR